MECLPNSSNKGVESRIIDGDNRSRPGRDWKEHTRTRPLDPRLCATIQSLVLFYWTLSAVMACLNDVLLSIPSAYFFP